jgi:hypothetical protein
MTGPSPIPLFEALNAYQKTEAMRAALSLDLFSAVAETHGTVRDVAARCAASERGIRVLCDFLVIQGFLSKTGERYALSPDTAPFLVKSSPAYLGDTVEFLQSLDLVEGFHDLAGCGRRGGTTISARGTMKAQHPGCGSSSRVMGPVIGHSAPFIADLVDAKADRRWRCWTSPPATGRLASRARSATPACVSRQKTTLRSPKSPHGQSRIP